MSYVVEEMGVYVYVCEWVFRCAHCGGGGGGGGSGPFHTKSSQWKSQG